MLTSDGILGLLKYAHSLRELSFGAIGVGYVLRKGAHKPETVKALEHIVDGLIEIKSVEGKYRSESELEIQKLRERQYPLNSIGIKCHRRFITRSLQRRSIRVIHIVDSKKAFELTAIAC